EQLAVDLEGHAHRAYRVFRSVHLVCQSAAVLVEDGGVYRRDDGVVEMILRINHLCGSSGNSARPCASPWGRCWTDRQLRKTALCGYSGEVDHVPSCGNPQQRF